MNQTITSELTPTVRHNAMISYCFLSIFMLISRQDQFAHPFVRAHAKYAFLIHLGFLALVIGLIFSRNFSSVILFEFSWVHIVLFVLFLSLLIALAVGIMSALRGQKPRFSLSILGGSKPHLTVEETKSTEDTNGVILSHIPLVGTYLVYKYGEKFASGARFGNWVLWCALFSIWIDPSLGFFLAITIAVVMWLVYQSLSLKTYGKMKLIGNHFWSANDINITLHTSWKYITSVTGSGHEMPHWGAMHDEIKKTYKSKTTDLPEKSAIPIINLVYFMKNRSNKESIWWQNMILTAIAIYGLVVSNYLLFGMTLAVAWWLFFQIRGKRDPRAPLLSEAGEIIQKFFTWKKEKSIPKETHLT